MNTILQNIDLVGSAFVKLLWPMILQSSLLIVALVTADILLRHKVRPASRYWMWMLLLVALVVPVSSLVSGVLEYWPGIETAHADRVVAPAEQNGVAAAAPLEEQARAAVQWPPTWQTMAFMTWALGVLGIAAWLVYRVMATKRLVAQAKDANGFMQDTLRFCCKSLGVDRDIRFKVSVKVTKPIVWGLFKPVIVIPHDLAPTHGARHLRAVLFHEIAHVKRGDLWANSLQTILQVLYFFNPLLWVANWMIRRVREHATNQVVMDTIGEHTPWYSETLADVSSLRFRPPVFGIGCVGVEESTADLKVA
jgi:bla regulator protein BlaR1